MFTIESQIKMSQVGPDGVATPMAIASLMQDCTILWMNSEPEFAKYLNENQIFMALTSRQIEMRKKLSLGEKVRVETRVYDCKPLLGFRNTTIYDESGEIAATSNCVGAWVSVLEGKAMRVPKEALEQVAIDEKIDMNYGKRKILIPESEPICPQPVYVRRSDIDANRHMNNTQYVRIAYDLLPEDFEICGMRLEYKNQARLGDAILPNIYYDSESRIVFELHGEKGETYAVVEFTN